MARSKQAVRSEMHSKVPSMTGNPGLYDRNKAPFDKPHSLGTGGVPTIFFTSLGEKKATKVLEQTSGPGTQTASRRK
jgi:hypothetical protein